MKYPKYFLPLFCLILLSISIIDAKPSPVNYGSLQINTWDVTTVKANESYVFVWDVSDSTGILLNNSAVNCSFFMIQAGTANQLIAGVAMKTPDNFGWYKHLNSNNFTALGQYNYQIDCFLLSNTSMSGNLLNTFEVNSTGHYFTLQDAFMYLGLLAFFVITFIFITGMIRSSELGYKTGGLALGYFDLLFIIYTFYYLFSNYIIGMPFIAEISYVALVGLISLGFPFFIILVGYLLWKMGESLTKKKKINYE